ncbi:MAG: hypothetical protein H8E21_09165 [Gammaproteobacteria bacterium]|nr:hypothetical protein [Gammaproteobacteria bacterium]MBL6999732.1 hypothetical protein [Gammaproteobacteria bacterium]
MNHIRYSLLFCCVLLLVSCGGGGGGGATNNAINQNSGSNPTASWKGPLALANPTLGSDGWGQNIKPTLLQDDSANTTALWYRWDGVAVSLYAAQLSAGGQWSGPERIENSDNDSVCKRAVNYCDRVTPAAIDSNGNITVAWPSWDGSQWLLAVNRYVPAQGWGGQTVLSTAAAVDQDNFPLTSANIMVDDGGRATIVWRSTEPANASPLANFWYAHFDGVNWSSGQLTTPTIPAMTDWAIEPVLGEISFAWYDSSSGFMARTFKPAGGWETATVLLTSAVSTSIAQVSLVYDNDGTVTALIQRNNSGFKTWVNRRISGGSWETSLLVASSGAIAYDSVSPKLVATSDGGIMGLLKWQPYVSTSLSPSEENWSLQYVTYTAVGGWSSVADLGNYFRGPFEVGSSSNGSVFVMDQSNARAGSTLPAKIRFWHFSNLSNAVINNTDLTI